MILKHGDQKKLADTAGVSVQFLSEILNGKKRCPSSLAVKLEQVSEEVLGQKVLARDWILAGLGIEIGKGGEL